MTFESRKLKRTNVYKLFINGAIFTAKIYRRYLILGKVFVMEDKTRKQYKMPLDPTFKKRLVTEQTRKNWIKKARCSTVKGMFSQNP